MKHPPQSHSDSSLPSGRGSLHLHLEKLEERLKRVELILSKLVVESPTPNDVSVVLQDRVLHRPDMILTGVERQMVASPYLDAEQAAVYLGITVSSLYGIVERRHLKPLRGPRRRYRFTKELLDEYLRRRTERR
jgi:excisionase family DNA binding protein